MRSHSHQSRNDISGVECVSKVSLTKDYAMLQCASSKTMTLHKVTSGDYIMSAEFYKLENMETDDATLTPFDDNLSTVHFTQSYAWANGQTSPMTFIDSLRIIKASNLPDPVVIRQERDIYFEVHALEASAWSYDDHIVG